MEEDNPNTPWNINPDATFPTIPTVTLIPSPPALPTPTSPPPRHRHPLSLSTPTNEVRPVGTFHWTTHEANTLWLPGWIPSMEDQYLSAFLGLFLMAILARGLGAMNIYLITCLRARDYNQLPLSIKSKKAVVNNNMMNNQRNSRASMFLLSQQQQHKQQHHQRLRQQYQQNNDNNNSARGIKDFTAATVQQPQQRQTIPPSFTSRHYRHGAGDKVLKTNNSHDRRTFTTPASSTVVATFEPSSSSKPALSQFLQVQYQQQAQASNFYNCSTRDFTSIDLSDNDNIYPSIIDDNPKHLHNTTTIESDVDGDDEDDDATTYMSAESTPYSIKTTTTQQYGKRRSARKPSRARMHRYSNVKNKHVYNKPVEPLQHQRQQSQLYRAKRQSSILREIPPMVTTKTRTRKAGMPWVPSFIWKTDALASLLTTLEYFLMFLLTMIVMTGNVPYFISILLGIFAGEMLFGRLRGSIHRLPINE